MMPILAWFRANTMEDEVLERVRSGDREALSALLEQNMARLADMAARRAGTEIRARLRISDLVQATLEGALEGLEGFKGSTHAEFQAWLGRILERKILDAVRSIKAQKRTQDKEATLSTSRVAEIPADARTPSAVAVGSEEESLLDRMLLDLPVETRQIFELRAKELLDFREIARLTGKTEGAARKAYCLARADLLVRFRERTRDG